MKLDSGDREPAARHYREMIQGVCRRAVDLQAPGLVVEIELLPPMTMDPAWGAEIIALVRATLDEFHDKHGLRSALRATPVDVRESERPPRMRSGALYETTLRTFDLCAREGADLLAIESTGGKELHDAALLSGDLAGVVFALGVLGARDMHFLWNRIVEIGRRRGALASGDTACGFANTAMVLADKGMISRVFAAVVRTASVPRSLAAYEAGAVGPSKDCAYEGPYMKAIAGVPISMEGRSSACAHLSHLGNIAGACCDLWSNESVQNVRLLSASAPVVSMEQLIYDCRLMNAASADGGEAALRLQRWMVESDARFDPQAWVLRPDVVVRISKRLCEGATPLARTLLAVDETIAVLREAVAEGELSLPPNEARWLDIIEMQREAIPDEAEELAVAVQSLLPEQLFIPEEYELAAIT